MKRQSGQRYQVNEAGNHHPLQKWVKNTPTGLDALTTCHGASLEDLGFYPELLVLIFLYFFPYFKL